MKLHLGCGRRHIPGWVHVDLASFPHVDHVHTVQSLPFIPDGAAEVVYASHILEHFPRAKTLDVLAEWHRVLRPGGILRVAVPDFEMLAQYYLNPDNVTNRFDLKSRCLDAIIGPLYGRQDDVRNIHYTVFDEPTLVKALHLTGFGPVRRYDPHRTEHAHVDDFSMAYLPHMDQQDGALISLNLEATKL